jgi:hypothetical protein
MNTQNAFLFISIALGVATCRSDLHTGIDDLIDAGQGDSGTDASGTMAGGGTGGDSNGGLVAGGTTGDRGQGGRGGQPSAPGGATGGDCGGGLACTTADAGDASPGYRGYFFTTERLSVARRDHTAIVLANGKVLILGGAGTNGESLASAELYDPRIGQAYDPNARKMAATGSMTAGRQLHAATLLSSGLVLVTGDISYATSPSSAGGTAELYDPAAGTFAATGHMNVARDSHTSTLLGNGKVLIAGGYDTNGGTTSAELYDPTSGIFTVTGSMLGGRAAHTATLLPNGRVLVTGGNGIGDRGGMTRMSAELYDPATGTFAATGDMTTTRFGHTATLLGNGKVLITGGVLTCAELVGTMLASAELYDPATGRFTAAGSMTTPKTGHTATLMRDGKVLIAGGSDGTRSLAGADLYDPDTDTFTATASMAEARLRHTATLLSDGEVLMVGGTNGIGYTFASTELFGYSWY